MSELSTPLTQKALRVSRVMQAFRAECVRERIIRDPASAHLLQRKHHRLLKAGGAGQQGPGEGRDARRAVHR